MVTLLDSAIQFLNDGGWRFTHNEDDNWASLFYTGESGSWLAWFQDRGASLVAYAVCPVKAPADRWPAISELIGRANYGLGVGNFEMSFEDGTIRYKNGIYAGDEQVSVAMVRHLFYMAVSTMDDHFPAIMAAIYGDTPPQLVVARVEEAIELRRVARARDSMSTVDPLIEDAVATQPQLVSDELESLLATLSAGFGAPLTGHPIGETLATEALDDGTQLQRQDDAP
jgi:hypothetical protein